MANKKYIKDGVVVENHFVKKEVVKDEQGNEKEVNVAVYGASEKDWKAAGYTPVEEYYAKAIAAVKNELAATDYIALKSVEGYDVDSLYPNWKENRAALRDQINALEAELNNIISE